MNVRSLWGLRKWQRHDLILAVAGVIYVMIGVSYILAEPTENRFVALQVVLSVASLEFWGWTFVTAGALSIISSKWPPFAETWGYMVLTGMPAGWSSAYLLGIVVADSPASNISGFFSWGLIAFLWWVISGLPNPERPAAKDDDERS